MLPRIGGIADQNRQKSVRKAFVLTRAQIRMGPWSILTSYFNKEGFFWICIKENVNQLFVSTFIYISEIDLWQNVL